ncbi:MAG: hypothetical protein SYC29_06405 [Planctomycetota bacterium]|nr:hypothetical protein [Planctomycetota bacterium]
MPAPMKNLKLLKRVEPASAGAILAAAIPCAAPEELVSLARAACETGHHAAIAAVLRVLHRLGGEGPDQALRHAPSGPLQEAVRRALTRPDRQTIENAIAVIERRGDAGLAHHLVDLLMPIEERDDIPQRAAEALLAITEATIGRTGRRIADRGAMARLDDALAAAGRGYRGHRRDAVLLSLALAAARPGPAVRRLLEEEDHPAILALRGVADDVRDPRVSGNLIRWLGVEPLAGPAARRLHRLEGLERWGEALRDGHLLLSPRRRRRLWRADRPLQCMPSHAQASALPPRAQIWTPVLVGGLDLSAHARLQRLSDMVALPSPTARLRAVLILLGRQGERAMEGLAAFCFDRDAAVARLASQRFLAGEATTEPGLMTKLARSEHAAVSRRAAANAARSSVAGFFRHWRRMSDTQRRSAAWCLLAAGRPRFVAGLRAVLREADPDDRLEAIRLVRRLRLADDLVGELIELAGSESARVASAAVAALPVGPDRRGIEALLTALRHEDARVRANAIERLARLGRSESLDVISHLSGCDENRPRANAIRAVLRGDRRRGVADLRRMLADSRPLHRVSAVWVARAGSVIEVAPELHRLAGEERLPEIRTRAQAAMRWLGRSRSPRRPEGAAR